jgi:hypothetical protein
MTNEQIITNFEAKRKELVSEANCYANDYTVPLVVSLELYAQIDRLTYAITKLQKRTKLEVKEV